MGDREIEASLLGSYASEMHTLTLELLLRAWQATHPEAALEVPRKYLPQERTHRGKAYLYLVSDFQLTPSRTRST